MNENAPAQRLPEYNSYTNGGMAGMAVEAEPDIIQAARAYEGARRELQELQRQRDKIEEAIKRAIHQQEEACMRIGSIIQPGERKQY